MTETTSSHPARNVPSNNSADADAEHYAEAFSGTDAALQDSQVTHEDVDAKSVNTEPVNTTESVETGLADSQITKPFVSATPDGQAPEPATQAIVAFSFASRCFAGCAHAGWFVLLVLVFLQTALGLITRTIWLPGELELSTALSAMRESGNWLFFVADGQAFSDLPPLYLWFLAGLAHLPGLPQPLPLSPLMLGGTALATFLCVFATWLLARSTGHDPRTALVAGCMTLISFTLSGFTMYASPVLLFTGALLLSLACLYRGWINDRAPFWLLAGFVLAAVATLVQSPLGTVLPLVTSVLFLFWRGTFRRAGQRDGALGFAVLLIILFGWLTYLTLTDAAKPYLTAYVLTHVQIQNIQTLSLNWWIPLIILVFIARPWPLLLLVAPWERIYHLPVAFWKARREAPGKGWLWWALITGIFALMLTPQPQFSTLAPLVPLIALVGAGTLMQLSSTRSRIFFSIIGVMFIIMALITACVALTPHVLTWLPSGVFEWLDAALAQSPYTAALVPVLPLIQAVQGLLMVAGVAFVAGIVLLRGTDKRAPSGALLVFVLFVTVLVQPVVYVTEPSLMAYWNPVTTSSPVAPEPDVTPHVAPGTIPSDLPVSEVPPALPQTLQPLDTPAVSSTLPESDPAVVAEPLSTGATTPLPPPATPANLATPSVPTMPEKNLPEPVPMPDFTPDATPVPVPVPETMPVPATSLASPATE